MSIAVGTEKLRRFSFWAPQTLEGVVSYFLSRFSEKESMAKKEGARGIPISPGPLKAAKTSPFGLFLDLFPAAYFFRTILRISRAGGGGGAKKGNPRG